MPNRNKLVAWVASVCGVIFLIWLIWTPLWEVIGGIWRGLLYILASLWQFVVTVVSLAASMIVYLVSVALWVAVFVALVAAVGMFVIWTLKLLLARIGEIGAQVKALGEALGEDGRRSARDAIFLSLLSFLLVAIVYAATDDFVEKFSTIRFLAACGIGFCVGKLFLMYPSRLAKGAGAVLTLALLVGALTFLNYRYGLAGDAHGGFANLRASLFPQAPELVEKQLIKLTVVVAIGILSLLAIAYPFRLAEWRKMLRVSPAGAHDSASSAALDRA